MVRTVSNAFETGRIPQAWILTGVRGVGKTTTARILARALNYELPDGSVKGPTIHMPVLGVHCQAIMESRHMDVLEMDAASHTGVDDVRQINDSVRYAPASARYKVYIIDEVHMLSTAAFNAFLKTLEEPPEHAKFVFATTEIRKVPVTVLSRCQRFDLRRVEADVLMAHLANIAAKENVEVEPEALGIIARAAEGSVRDSLSLFDQAIAHAAGPVRADAVRQMLGLADRTRVIDLFDSLARGDIASAFREFRDQYDTGADPIVVLSDLAEFVNFVTRVKIVPATADNVAFGETERLRARDFAAKLSMRVLSRMWQMLLKGITEVQAATRPAAAAEMVLVRIAYVADMPTPDEAIRMLEQNGGASPVVAANAAPRERAGSGRCRRCSRSPAARAFRAARRRRGVRPPADDRADAGGAVGAGGAADRELSRTGGARRREARPADQGRAGSRCAAGPHRGRPARGRAGAQRGADAGQRSLAQAGAMDRAALDRDRVQRAGPADAAFAERGRRRTSASAPPKPIRGCRRCWRGFPAPRSSRCASLPPSRRNPMLAVKTRPRAPTATINSNLRRNSSMADFLGMMKQAAQLQSKMQAMQEELGHVEVEGISGGGLVTVRMTAKMEVKAVKIDPSLMKADEREILEDCW